MEKLPDEKKHQNESNITISYVFYQTYDGQNTAAYTMKVIVVDGVSEVI